MPDRSHSSDHRTTPIFICGSARSGTTLLLRLLDAHPDLAVLPEETYLYQDLLLRRRISWFVVHAAERLDRPTWPGFLAQPSLRWLTFGDRSALRARLETWTQSFERSDAARAAAIDWALEDLKAGDSYWNTFLDVYDRLAPGRLGAARYWVEKTPSNERFVALHERDFERRARYLHILRDPRDAAASWLKRRRAEPSERDRTLVRICYLWSMSVHRCAWGVRALPSRYHAMRYEDLVQRPRDEMQQVCAFLGLPMTDALLTATRLGDPIAMNTSYADGESTGEVVASQIGRFREELTADEIRFVEALLGAQMRAYGYLRETSGPEATPDWPSLLPRGARESWKSRAQARRSWRLQRECA